MSNLVQPWSPVEDDLAKRLWIEGQSASQIARAMKMKRSRNAVIGRLFRLGFMAETRQAPQKPPMTDAERSARWRAMKAPKVARQTKCRGPKPAPRNRPGDVFGKVSAPLDPVAADRKRDQMRALGQQAIGRVDGGEINSPNAMPILEHRSGCRWPLGERGAIRFCCNPVMTEGRPYCAGHHALAVSKDQPKQMKAPRAANDQSRKTPRVQTDWDYGREAA